MRPESLVLLDMPSPPGPWRSDPQPLPHMPQHWPCPRPTALPCFLLPAPTSALGEQGQRARPGPLEEPQARPCTTSAGAANLDPGPVFVQLVITALKCHKYDKNIQVTGSAALFYLTNSEYRSEQSVKLRRQVIQVVLNGMESYQEVTVSPFPPRPCMLWPSPAFPALPPPPASPACSQIPQGTALAPTPSHLALLCLPPRTFPAVPRPDPGAQRSGPTNPAPLPTATHHPGPLLTPQPFRPGAFCWGLFSSIAVFLVKVIKTLKPTYNPTTRDSRH